MEEKLISLIVRKVPASVHKALKVKAASNGKTMQALILEIIKRYIARN